VTTRLERTALLVGASLTLGVLALAEEFHHLPAAVVAFAAAHVVIARNDET
jgi:hypothetical protein